MPRRLGVAPAEDAVEEVEALCAATGVGPAGRSPPGEVSVRSTGSELRWALPPCAHARTPSPVEECGPRELVPDVEEPEKRSRPRRTTGGPPSWRSRERVPEVVEPVDEFEQEVCRPDGLRARVSGQTACVHEFRRDHPKTNFMHVHRNRLRHPPREALNEHVDSGMRRTINP